MLKKTDDWLACAGVSRDAAWSAGVMWAAMAVAAIALLVVAMFD